MRIDRRRLGKDVAGEIGGNHDLRAERACHRYRHRIDKRAVDQPAVTDQNGREDAGQGVRRTHRIDDAAVGQPNLVPGPNLGGDAREFDRQFLDQRGPERGLQLRGQLLAADQARSVKAHIEIAQDVAQLQAARPFFQPVEMSGRERTANHRANRGADHDIGNDAVGSQRPQDADMSEAARRPAAEGDADHWPPDTTQADFIAYFLAHLLAVIRLALAASDQYFEHINTPGALHPDSDNKGSERVADA